MTGPQLTGAGLGAILGGILVNALHKYVGYDVTLTDGTAIVAAFIGGVGVTAHAVVTYGIRGIGAILWRGQPKPPGVTILVPPVPPVQPGEE